MGKPTSVALHVSNGSFMKNKWSSGPTADLDFVKVGLQSLDDKALPELVREMLCHGLPFAEAHGKCKVRHVFQTQVLEMAKQSLNAARRSATEALSASASKAEAVKADFRAAVASRDAAAAAEDFAAADSTARESDFARACEASEVAQGEFLLAKLSLERADKELMEIEPEREMIAALFQGPLCVLLQDSVKARAARERAVAELVEHRLLRGAEPALLTAIPHALVRLPAQQQPFDQATVRSLLELLEVRAADADARAADVEQRQSEAAGRVAAALGARAAAQKVAEAAVDALAAATQARVSAAAARCAHEAGMAERQVAASASLSAEALLEERVRGLDLVLSAVARLMVTGQDEFADAAAALGGA